MKNDNVALIQRILAGDQRAFAKLVRKYQKPVHALAWRRIGDFHIAEEVTQDTFLQVYKKLGSLKDPHRFEGWLYRIASRQCHAWLRKKRMQTQSLEETDGDLLNQMTYSEYIAEEQAKAATEAQRNIVHKLLARLRESERTVVTLHYFGEMTCEEISRFLGISPSTVKSRLRRARLRLKKAEPMIREALEEFQIRVNLTENIMQEISRIAPVVPSGGKPFIPWAIAASTLALVVLALGVSHEYLTRFQQPYNFDATSEMTVELIDTPIVLNLASKPDVRTQIGKSTIPNSGSGFTPNTNPSEYVPRFLTAQTQIITLNDAEPTRDVLNILRTPDAEYQDYTVVEIDATTFKDGGILTVDLWMGRAEAAGAFILFESDSELATNGMPKAIRTAASGIVPGKSGKLTYHFDKGRRFKLGATGNSFSGKGKVNSFLAKISINSQTKSPCIPNAKHLTPTAVSYIISPCHEKIKFSASVIQPPYSRSRRINGEKSRLKRTRTHNTSSSPSSEEPGDPTVAASCRQCRRISRLMKCIPLRRSPSLDSGPVRSEALSKKMESHSRY